MQLCSALKRPPVDRFDFFTPVSESSGRARRSWSIPSHFRDLTNALYGVAEMVSSRAWVQKSVKLRDDFWSPQSGDFRNPLTLAETYWNPKRKMFCEEFFPINFWYLTILTKSTNKMKTFIPLIDFLKNTSFLLIFSVGDYAGSAICCSTVEPSARTLRCCCLLLAHRAPIQHE